MKMLMLHINPRKEFQRSLQTPQCVKVSIDNSLDLGWKREDILLVTNFPYEYNGIKSTLVSDEFYCPINFGRPSKINVFIDLIEKGIIGDDLWWFHDFDAWQTYPITEKELGLEDKVAGFTTYGWQSRWNTGSIFFKKEALPIFQWLKEALYSRTDIPSNSFNEESVLGEFTRNNYRNINSIIKKMNVTYNFPGCANGVRHLKQDYDEAIKPVKVLHFHVFYGWNNYLHAMCGKNDLKLNLVPDRLLNIFKVHMKEFCP